MTVYRTIVTVTAPCNVTETYHSPWCTLFPSFKCAYERERKFVNDAVFLYISNHIDPTVDFDIEKVETKIDYKKFHVSVWKDLYNKIRTRIKFNI